MSVCAENDPLSVTAAKAKSGEMPVDEVCEFLERLIHATLPRIRDFRGVSAKSFDGRGNYTLGLKEQTLFPEIEADKVKRVQGMDITIVTTAKTNEDAKELLKLLGMPFANA